MEERARKDERLKAKPANLDLATQDELLSTLYHEFALMGSQAELLSEAVKKDKSITATDVKSWFERNVVRTGNLKGYSSFIPD